MLCNTFLNVCMSDDAVDCLVLAALALFKVFHDATELCSTDESVRFCASVAGVAESLAPKSQHAAEMEGGTISALGQV